MKTKIKMIVADLDGTLLKSDKTISDMTRAVLNRCQDNGIKVVYATGRGSTARKLTYPQHFDGRVINNGAFAYVEDKEVYKRLIPSQTARLLLTACAKLGIRVTAEANDIHYSNFVTSDVWPIVSNYEIVDFEKFCFDTEKICILYRNQEDIAFIQSQMTDELYLFLARDGFAIASHRDAIKSKGIKAVAKVFSIDMSEVVAFGDDLNDLDMFERVGMSIAMGNAVERVKAAADFVCGGNDEDGVAEWLEKNIL